jgi:hypothetical protein
VFNAITLSMSRRIKDFLGFDVVAY